MLSDSFEAKYQTLRYLFLDGVHAKEIGLLSFRLGVNFNISMGCKTEQKLAA